MVKPIPATKQAASKVIENHVIKFSITVSANFVKKNVTKMLQFV